MREKVTPPPATEPVASKNTVRKLPTLEELEKRGFRVLRGEGKAISPVGAENFVSSLRRAAAKQRSGGSE